MRSNTGLRAALSALAIFSFAVPAAVAGTRDHDRVYADSYGNLVVESTAGFKRILVGEGSQARALQNFTGSGQVEPSIVYADSENGTHVVEGCYRAPWLIKGRSYMYGFDQGEIPFRGGPCR